MRSFTLSDTSFYFSAMDKSEIPEWLSHLALSPFFFKILNSIASLNCCGTFSIANSINNDSE